MPLNIFEPRYLAMIDAALAGDRIIGMIQPDEAKAPCALGPGLCTVGCAGRITSFAETGDGRYMITLTGIARFRIVEELAADHAVPPVPGHRRALRRRLRRRCRRGGRRPRRRCSKTFRAYLEAHNLEADWDSVGRASNETLVNALAMMAPFGPAEKQALLEAPGPSRPRRDPGRAHRDVARRATPAAGRSLQ